MSRTDAPAPDQGAAGEPPIDASVIVPTYADWDALAGCLACLSGQDLPAERFEIVIGDNNADADPPGSLVLPGNARLVRQTRVGSYAARNAAVTAARGSTLFFTDADCRPEPDWLRAGLRLLAEQPGVDRIGGAVLMTSREGRWSTPELHDRLFNLRQDRYVARDYAATANLVVRRELFERVGPFDETLRSSGDKEWNRRAAALGSRIVHGSDVRVRHPARASFAEHAAKRARVAQGRLRMKLDRGRRAWLSPLKYLLPSLPAAVRIARAPALSIGQRLALLAFDYRLRLHEARVTSALLAGSARVYR